MPDDTTLEQVIHAVQHEPAPAGYGASESLATRRCSA